MCNSQLCWLHRHIAGYTDTLQTAYSTLDNPIHKLMYTTLLPDQCNWCQTYHIKKPREESNQITHTHCRLQQLASAFFDPKWHSSLVDKLTELLTT